MLKKLVLVTLAGLFISAVAHSAPAVSQRTSFFPGIDVAKTIDTGVTNIIAGAASVTWDGPNDVRLALTTNTTVTFFSVPVGTNVLGADRTRWLTVRVSGGDNTNTLAFAGASINWISSQITVPTTNVTYYAFKVVGTALDAFNDDGTVPVSDGTTTTVQQIGPGTITYIPIWIATNLLSDSRVFQSTNATGTTLTVLTPSSTTGAINVNSASGDAINLLLNGTENVTFFGSTIQLPLSGTLSFSTGNSYSGAASTKLKHEGVGTIGQQNGTLAQKFRVYASTNSGTGDYSRVSLEPTGSQQVYDSQAGGAGTYNPHVFSVGGTNGLIINATNTTVTQSLGIGTTTNLLIRSGSDLVYTNGSTSGSSFIVKNQSSTLTLGLNAGGQGSIQSSGGFLTITPIVQSSDIVPTSAFSKHVGAISNSSGTYDYMNAGKFYVTSFDNASGSYERLVIDFRTSTNVFVINSDSSGIGTNKPIVFQMRGTEVGRFSTNGVFSANFVWNVRTITSADSPYTVISTDQVILCNAVSGNITVNLPAAATSSRGLTIKKTDASGNTVTIDGNASETIDGSTTKVTTTQYFAWDIQSDLSNWFIK